MDDIKAALEAIQSRADKDPGQQLGDAQTDREYLLAITRQLLDESETAQEAIAAAWDEGHKQGGPMHDVNYDELEARNRNPYRA